MSLICDTDLTAVVGVLPAAGTSLEPSLPIMVSSYTLPR